MNASILGQKLKRLKELRLMYYVDCDGEIRLSPRKAGEDWQLYDTTAAWDKRLVI